MAVLILKKPMLIEGIFSSLAQGEINHQDSNYMRNGYRWRLLRIVCDASSKTRKMSLHNSKHKRAAISWLRI